MYAVIKTGGKQYRVQEGDVLSVEKIDTEVGGVITFDEILMSSDGEKASIGTPTVAGASVEASIDSHGKAKKVIIIKFKRRKHHMKKQGHRQNFTKIKINKINLG